MRTSFYQIGLIVLAIIIVVVVVSIYLPFADDWHHTFRPATRELIFGRSPYNIETYFNAPWALFPLVPLAALPENIGRAGLLVMSLAAFAFTAYRLGAKPVSLAFFLLSPPVVHCFLTGNIDWLVIMGFAFPPQIGLFFLMIKPQIGVGVILFWLVEAWRRNGLTNVIRIFAPVTIVFVISVGLFGMWPLGFRTAIATSPVNASVWPIAVPVGLALLVTAIRKRNLRFAIGASPCLTPYLTFQSWAGALVAVVPLVPETVAAVIGLWILVAIRFGEM